MIPTLNHAGQDWPNPFREERVYLDPFDALIKHVSTTPEGYDAAKIIRAYVSLLELPQKERNAVCAALKKTRKPFKVPMK